MVRTTMPRRRPKIKAGPIFALLLALASCGLPGGKVKLPTNPLLSQSSLYAVVEASYLVLKAAARQDAADSGYARRGDVLELMARVRVEGGDEGGVLWYGLRTPSGEAWAPASEIELYDSREKATTAAAALR